MISIVLKNHPNTNIDNMIIIFISYPNVIGIFTNLTIPEFI